jgi:hypothetical protein
MGKVCLPYQRCILFLPNLKIDTPHQEHCPFISPLLMTLQPSKLNPFFRADQEGYYLFHNVLKGHLRTKLQIREVHQGLVFILHLNQSKHL